MLPLIRLWSVSRIDGSTRLSTTPLTAFRIAASTAAMTLAVPVKVRVGLVNPTSSTSSTRATLDEGIRSIVPMKLNVTGAGSCVDVPVALKSMPPEAIIAVIAVIVVDASTVSGTAGSIASRSAWLIRTRAATTSIGSVGSVSHIPDRKSQPRLFATCGVSCNESPTSRLTL